MTDKTKTRTGLTILEEGAPIPHQSLAQSAQQSLLQVETPESMIDNIITPLDDYSDIILSPDQSEKLQRHLKKTSLGASSFIPLTCTGAACPFAARCPLVQMDRTDDNPHGKAPINRSCLLETTALADWLSTYIREYKVDPSSFTEINICAELAELEVMLWRLNMQLANPANATLVVDQVVGVTPRGEELTQLQISPIVMAKQQLNTRKSKLVKLMVGDRQEKYKREAALKQKQEADPSTKQAATKAKLEALQRELDTQAIDGEVLTPEQLIEQNSNKR